jgi:hypothetical protein
MSDFLLEPDELDPERPARSRPVRLVATGLADTAALPPSATRGPDRPPCYAPCEACGALVLTGRTPTGTRLALDTQRTTYTINWLPGTPEPTLHESRGYLMHRCQR